MEYALIACFDDSLEKEFISTWELLRDKSVSNYGFEFEGKVPHITLADFELASSDVLIKRLQEYFSNVNKFSVMFNSLGIFLKTETLYYACLKDELLYKTHLEFHNAFLDLTDNKSFYIPSKWVPHATIASRLGENMTKAVELCKDHSVLSGKVNRVVLIELSERTEGNVSGVKEIWSMGLNDEE